MALADNAAAANNNESPGRNGKITAPVSIKMIANRIKYVELPKVLTMLIKWSSMCSIKSIRVLKKSFLSKFIVDCTKFLYKISRSFRAFTKK